MTDLCSANVLLTAAPRPMPVQANTLVVADTFGGRTPSPAATRRVEIYATLRRNPFLPWTGLDPLSQPAIREHMGSFPVLMDGLDAPAQLSQAGSPT